MVLTEMSVMTFWYGHSCPPQNKCQCLVTSSGIFNLFKPVCFLPNSCKQSELWFRWRSRSSSDRWISGSIPNPYLEVFLGKILNPKPQIAPTQLVCERMCEWLLILISRWHLTCAKLKSRVYKCKSIYQSIYFVFLAY